METLVGKPGIRPGKAGVYILTHKVTGDRYVGSSNHLARRLHEYKTFKKFYGKNRIYKESGKLLPLLAKDGLVAFDLEIFVLPEELNTGYNHMLLEQWFLLDSHYNLNTHSIVNFRVNGKFSVYVYDSQGKILYYRFISWHAIRLSLGVHPKSMSKCIRDGKLYLDHFLITHVLNPDAQKAGLSLEELSLLMKEKRSLQISKVFSLAKSNPIYI